MGIVEKVRPPPRLAQCPSRFPDKNHRGSVFFLLVSLFNPQCSPEEMARSTLDPYRPYLLLTRPSPKKQGQSFSRRFYYIQTRIQATEYHLGLLKAKLARYRAQLLEPTTKSGPAGVGFDVQKSGDARVALIGFPSVGKVRTDSAYSRTTTLSIVHLAQQDNPDRVRGCCIRIYYSYCKLLKCTMLGMPYSLLEAIPGVIEYKGARIQLLDLPGIIEGASQGRGRGRQVVSSTSPIPMVLPCAQSTPSAAKTADLILIMLDATKSDEQRRLLEVELDAVGIRLNKRKPDIVFKKKTTGGVRTSFRSRSSVNLMSTRLLSIRLLG